MGFVYLERTPCFGAGSEVVVRAAELLGEVGLRVMTGSLEEGVMDAVSKFGWSHGHSAGSILEAAAAIGQAFVDSDFAFPRAFGFGAKVAVCSLTAEHVHSRADV